MTNEQLMLAKNVVELLGFIVISIFTVRLHVRAKKVEKGTEKVAEVTKDIHTLVNSNMGEQKKANMLLAVRLAELTQKPEDIVAAEKARLDYAAHEAKQQASDLTH